MPVPSSGPNSAQPAIRGQDPCSGSTAVHCSGSSRSQQKPGSVDVGTADCAVRSLPLTSNSSTNSNTSQPRNPPPPPPIRVRGRCEVAGRPCQSQPHNGPSRPRSGQPSRRRRARALRLPELSSQQPSHSPTHYPGRPPAPNPAAPSTRPDAMPSRTTSARGSCRRPTSKNRPRCP